MAFLVFLIFRNFSFGQPKSELNAQKKLSSSFCDGRKIIFQLGRIGRKQFGTSIVNCYDSPFVLVFFTRLTFLRFIEGTMSSQIISVASHRTEWWGLSHQSNGVIRRCHMTESKWLKCKNYNLSWEAV